MKLLLIHLVCLLLVCSSCYSNPIVKETATSQSPGLFRYFGNFWKNPFWSSANNTAESPASVSKPITRIHALSRTKPTKIYASTSPSTSEQPVGILNNLKNWVRGKLKAITNKPATTIVSHTITRIKNSTGKHPSATKTTNHSVEDFTNTSKIIENSAQTVIPVTQTTVDHISGAVNSTSSEYSSSEETIELDSREKIISAYTTTVQTTSTLIILPSIDDSHQNESTVDTISSNETTPDAESNIQLDGKRLAQIIPGAQTTVDHISRAVNSTSSEYSSSEDTFERDSREEIISASTSTVQTTSTLIIIPSSDNIHRNGSTIDVISSNETTPNAEAESTIQLDGENVNSFTFVEEINLSARQRRLSKIKQKKRRSDPNKNKLTPYYFSFYSDDLGNNSSATSKNFYYRTFRRKPKTSRRKTISEKTTTFLSKDSEDSDNSDSSHTLYV